MRRSPASRALVLSLAILLWLASSAHAEELRYKPEDSVLGTLTRERALDLLRQLVGGKVKTAELAAEVNAGRYVFWLDERGETLSNTSDHVKRVEVLEDRIRMVTEATTIEFPYADLPDLEAFHESPGLFDHGRTGIGLSKDKDLLVGMPTSDLAQTRAFLRKLADTLYTLKRAAEGVSPEDDEAFARALAQYTSGTRPEFPEEARRFRVQAEAAVRGKRLRDAAALYRKALDIAPWWPEGRFNRSLILGELGRFPEAISEMKRYLALDPNAPNARAARDKIYEWEAAPPPAKP